MATIWIQPDLRVRQRIREFPLRGFIEYFILAPSKQKRGSAKRMQRPTVEIGAAVTYQPVERCTPIDRMKSRTSAAYPSIEYACSGLDDLPCPNRLGAKTAKLSGRKSMTPLNEYQLSAYPWMRTIGSSPPGRRTYSMAFPS